MQSLWAARVPVVASILAVSLGGCGGAGTDPRSDAGGWGPDAAAACPEALACGGTCCRDGQACLDGACVSCGCGTRTCGQDACGKSCGSCAADQTCEAASGTCRGACAVGQTACGAHCCDDATQHCMDGACHENASMCSAMQVACGASCCDPMTEICDAATHACQPEPACGSGQTACGATCCDDAAQVCNPVTAACEARTGCGAMEVPCGSTCCNHMTESCDASSGTCVAKAEACNPVAQTGCGTGQGCYWGAGLYECEPAGSAPAGSRCEEDAECAPGFGCFGSGKCTRYCAPLAAGACADDQTCQDLGDGTGYCSAGATPSCDPVTQSGCGSGEGCYFDGAGYSCFAAGGSPAGGGCLEDSDCAPGAGCFGTGSGTCSPYCDPFGEDPCPDGAACVDLGGGAGYCELPGARACDPVAQTGCEAGAGCYWDDASMAYACASAGASGLGGACGSDFDCVAGASCAGGLCRSYCDAGVSPTPCPGVRASCSDFGDGFGVCVNGQCDPLAQDCASAGQACYPAFTGAVCSAPGTAKPGEGCASDTDCVKGAGCFVSSSTSKCFALCDPTATGACTSPQTCLEVGNGLGVCF